MAVGSGTAAIIAAMMATMSMAPQTVEQSNAKHLEDTKPVVKTVTVTKKPTTQSKSLVTTITKTQSQTLPPLEEVVVTPESTDINEDTPMTPGTIPGVSVELEQKFDQLSQCESGGDWHINTGNGFYGGLQFTPSTWDAFGGEKYAPDAHQATREQQIEIAAKVLEGQGWGAWPACTAKFGWR